MGPKASNANNEYSDLLKQFEIVRHVQHEGLYYLKNRQSASEYLLREFTFNDKKEFDKNVELLDKKKSQLKNCKHLVPLEKIITKSEDQYCSTFHKIYALFPFTDRTLENEINDRNLENRQFQQKDLWSILASCILGLGHLQKNGIKHSSLRSNSILISANGIVKIYDPITTGCQTNYQILLSKRSTTRVYLSPQLTDSLQLEAGSPNCNSYKSDIFILGMIILEAGLCQYQDQCYRDQCSRIHWQTVYYNLHKFKQTYSEQLTAMLELMLSKSEKNRPDFIQLQQKVIEQQQSRVSLQNNSRDNHSKRTNSENVYQMQYKPPSARENPVNNLINTQTALVNQNPTTSKIHSHLYKPSNASHISNFPSSNSKATSIIVPGPVPSYRSTNPILEPSNRSSMYLFPIKPSQIDRTRPCRTIFPNSTYITTTKVDQNLIVVAEQQKFSETGQTPYNNKFNSSYFDSNPKSKIEVELHQQSHKNTFTPNQPAYQQQYRGPTQINTYGVSMFQSQPSPILTTLTNQYPIVPKQHTPYIQLTQQKQSDLQYVIQRYKQGSEYKGYKLDGLRHGYGVFYYQDGGMYQGQWKYNMMEGKGKLFYQSGKLAFDGQWLNDQFSGKGILHNEYPQILHSPYNYTNFDDIDEYWTKYEGIFKQDLKSGRGILFLSNGQYYDGQFKQDLAHGEGTYYCMNGQKITGVWTENHFNR